ncbi:helix-turn-helix transcriptional regulator [Lysinibacillus sp. 1 U-2021]|uniref:helix-turn-helix transcriptional regulator n=1 Tax=Lysinibacillus sp. 1 U-2021 TaxID=3039426 RepID=UPI0024815B92|nr:helix-turn-helix transcriptional regulator [Lysinibacillus sp. 1 U-2021]WGT38539.1 helix-turn-helix transcriptional regulator [Lysinibacillus sp. 1 U-2021]
MSIRITLRAARVNAGLTLTEAAKMFGINKDTLSKYEQDSTNVPRTFMLNIEQLYKIPIENIFFGKQSEFFRKFERIA